MPEGGRFEATDGDGDAVEALVPLAVVCSDGGAGRFNLLWEAPGLADTAVAMSAVGLEEVAARATALPTSSRCGHASDRMSIIRNAWIGM